MKKLYNKPEIQKHYFTMDINIMSQADKERLEQLKEMFVWMYGEKPSGDDDPRWIAFINSSDGAVSGWCYFTTVTPS
jgi:hypothetical protein